MKSKIGRSPSYLIRNPYTYSDDIDVLFPIPSEPTKSQSPASQLDSSSIALEELIEELKKQKTASNQWSAKWLCLFCCRPLIPAMYPSFWNRFGTCDIFL